MRAAMSHSSRWFRNLLSMIALQWAAQRLPAAPWCAAAGPESGWRFSP
jgi:hypothetical protein